MPARSINPIFPFFTTRNNGSNTSSLRDRLETPEQPVATNATSAKMQSRQRVIVFLDIDNQLRPSHSSWYRIPSAVIGKGSSLSFQGLIIQALESGAIFDRQELIDLRPLDVAAISRATLATLQSLCVLSHLLIGFPGHLLCPINVFRSPRLVRTVAVGSMTVAAICKARVRKNILKIM